MKKLFLSLMVFVSCAVSWGLYSLSHDAQPHGNIVQKQSTFNQHQQQLWNVAFSPDGQLLASETL